MPWIPVPHRDNGAGMYVQDIYNLRPLPYIIGTQAFMDSADAGNICPLLHAHDILPPCVSCDVDFTPTGLGDLHGVDDYNGGPALEIAAGSDSDASDEEDEDGGC